VNYTFTPIGLLILFVLFVLVIFKPELMLSKEEGGETLRYKQIKKYVRIFFIVLAIMHLAASVIYFGWIHR